MVAPACVLLLLTYLIFKFILLPDRLPVFFRPYRDLNQATTFESTSRKIIADPISNVEDANPVDITRLCGFLLASLLFVLPYLV